MIAFAVKCRNMPPWLETQPFDVRVPFVTNRRMACWRVFMDWAVFYLKTSRVVFVKMTVFVLLPCWLTVLLVDRPGVSAVYHHIWCYTLSSKA